MSRRHSRSSSSLTLALVIAATAVALPAMAAADEPVAAAIRAPARVEVSAGVAGGLTQVADGRVDTQSGPAGGLHADVAVFPLTQLGLVADAGLTWAHPSECPADAGCFNHVAEEQTTLTAGVRWRPTRAVFVQGTAGLAISRSGRYDGADDERAATAMIAAGWRRDLGDRGSLGIGLRVGGFKVDDTVVTNVALALSVGFGL